MEKEGSGLLKEVAIGDWHLTPTLSAVVAWDRQVRDVYEGMRKINKRKGEKKRKKEKEKKKNEKKKRERVATREVGKRERKEWSSEKRVVVNGYGLVEGNKRKKN